MKNNYKFRLVFAAVFSLLSMEGMAQLYPFTTHTFTPCGATGPTGPTLGDCTTAYASETWTADPSFFNMTTQGIQEWTVPATGNYSIEVFGAQGGDDTYTSGPEDGGLGARLYGEFSLTEGQVIYILAGQKGVNTKVTYADNAAPGGGIDGDLLVVITEEEDANLKRNGINLHYDLYVSFVDAALGGEAEIPMVGSKAKIKIEPGTQSGKLLRLKNKGIPDVNGYGRGDLLVNINIWTPQDLNDSEKSTLENLRESENFQPNPGKKDKGFFARVKEMFQ